MNSIEKIIMQANKGDAEAQLSLGEYYESEANCDLNKVATLYLLAANQGNKEARRKLEKLKNDIIVNKNNLGGEETGDKVRILEIIKNNLRYLQKTDVDIARNEVDKRKEEGEHNKDEKR